MGINSLSIFFAQRVLMVKKQELLGINPYVANNGSRDQSLTGIGDPWVTLDLPQKKKN